MIVLLALSTLLAPVLGGGEDPSPPYPGTAHNMYGLHFTFPTSDNYYNATSWEAAWVYNETGASTLGDVFLGLFEAPGGNATRRVMSMPMDANCSSEQNTCAATLEASAQPQGSYFLGFYLRINHTTDANAIKFFAVSDLFGIKNATDPATPRFKADSAGVPAAAWLVPLAASAVLGLWL